MHLPTLISQRFATALNELTQDADQYASMIRGTSDPNFGDFQANCAMPLSKKISGNTNPRDVAKQIVDRLDIESLCNPPEIAGPGFINLKLKDDFLLDSLRAMLSDDRLLVSKVDQPQKVVIDFSGPNVAKPMHVGHIRSTVIGDALTRIIRFLGHDVVTDNHLGDWGTQFGIIIYGYKNFGDPETVAKDPVPELAKLYRLVNQLIEYVKAKQSLGQFDKLATEADAEIDAARDAIDDELQGKKLKSAKKRLASAEKKRASVDTQKEAAEEKIRSVENDANLHAKAVQHPKIDEAVLLETVKLHQGDVENLKLWNEFLPFCKDEINRIYDRLDVSFDHTLGESFYHPMLAKVVADLKSKGLARQSEGAVCVFLDEFDSPMIVQKKDGAFLYSTTDLATLRYRLEQFAPDEVIYVVDTRQSEHFEKLFALAEKFDLGQMKLVHVNFGTVLGEDGRPMKTRSGSLIGLEGLLDDAVEKARSVVCDAERLQRIEPPMDEDEIELVAQTVGLGAIKYADLSHHRTSDYKFSLDKMVSLDGNTSAYVQYSYARTQGILRRLNKTESDIVTIDGALKSFSHPAERSLALMLLRLEEALTNVRQDYAPNILVDYLYETAKAYAVFNDNCPVMKAEDPSTKSLREALVALCGKNLRLGLSLLGINVVPRM